MTDSAARHPWEDLSPEATGPARVPLVLGVSGALCAGMLAAFVPDYALAHAFPVPLPPPSIFVGLLFLLALLAVAVRGRVPVGREAMALGAWSLAFLGLGVIGALASGGGERVQEILKNRLYDVLTLAGTYLLAREARTRRLFVGALALALGLSLACIAVDLARPATFSRVLDRAAGFCVNPTVAGQGLVAMMIALWEDVPVRWRGPFFLAVALGVLGTFSRGSMIALALFWAGAWVTGLWDMKRGWLGQVLVLGGVVGLVVLVQSGVLTHLGLPFISEDTLLRLRVGTSDESGLGRMTILQRAWEKVQMAPFLGHGLGASLTVSDQSTHNLHMTYWIDHGLAGLALIPGLLWPLLKGSGSARLFFAYGLLFACFSHNMLDERNFLIPCAVLLARREALSRPGGAP